MQGSENSSPDGDLDLTYRGRVSSRSRQGPPRASEQATEAGERPRGPRTPLNVEATHTIAFLCRTDDRQKGCVQYGTERIADAAPLPPSQC